MRQPFSYASLPLLASETAAVLASDVGLGARCLVLDLDDTLWGGIVGEEGPPGRRVGEGPEGEAYADFQEYLRELGRRGMLLAVASKNDAEVARAPFCRTRACGFGSRTSRRSSPTGAGSQSSWSRSPRGSVSVSTRSSSQTTTLPSAQRSPPHCRPSTRWCSTYPLRSSSARSRRAFASSYPRDDRRRCAKGFVRRSRGAEALRASAASLEDFWQSLEMSARVRDIDEGSIERAAQLTQKTNQFNLTLVRRTVEEVRQLAAEPSSICKTLELKDRFAQHGIVGLVFAVPSDEDAATLVLDTLLLSCRVIGRTAETHLISHVSRIALERGCVRLRGSYVHGPRNSLVADLFPRLGFVPVPDHEGVWDYDLAANGPLQTAHIHDIQ